jgi:hypothetical protein
MILRHFHFYKCLVSVRWMCIEHVLPIELSPQLVKRSIYVWSSHIQITTTVLYVFLTSYILWINASFLKADRQLNPVSFEFPWSHSNVISFARCIKNDEILSQFKVLRCLGFNHVNSTFQFLHMLTLWFFVTLISTNV